MRTEVVGALHHLPGSAAFAERLATFTGDRLRLADAAAVALADSRLVVLDAGSTTYLVAERLLDAGVSSNVRRVVTPNLAVSLLLAGSSIECRQLGGVVDDLHLCTIPDAPALELMRAELASADATFVLTAAACSLAEDGLWVRARRPDQFAFKRTMLEACRSVVLAVEARKFVDEFDGVHEFPLAGPEVAGETGEPVEATPGRGHAPRPPRPVATAGLPDRRTAQANATSPPRRTPTGTCGTLTGTPDS